MLVLTRKMQERIQIGNNITITILRVKGNSVRVGIDAPREIRVVRGELSHQIDDGQIDDGEKPTVTEEVRVVADEFESDTEDASSVEEPSASYSVLVSI